MAIWNILLLPVAVALEGTLVVVVVQEATEPQRVLQLPLRPTQSLSVEAVQELTGAGVLLALIAFFQVLRQTVVVEVEDVTLLRRMVDREVLEAVQAATTMQAWRESQPHPLFKVTTGDMVLATPVILVAVAVVQEP